MLMIGKYSSNHKLLKRKANDSEDKIRNNEQSSDNRNAQQNDGPGPLVVSTKKSFNLEGKKFNH